MTFPCALDLLQTSVQLRTAHRQIGLRTESVLSPGFAAVIARAQLAVQCTALLLSTCCLAVQPEGHDSSGAQEAARQLQTALLGFLQSVANTPLPKAGSQGVSQHVPLH